MPLQGFSTICRHHICNSIHMSDSSIRAYFSRFLPHETSHVHVCACRCTAHRIVLYWLLGMCVCDEKSLCGFIQLYRKRKRSILCIVNVNRHLFYRRLKSPINDAFKMMKFLHENMFEIF